MTVNRFAGMGSHQSNFSETDVWLTPPAIIEALGGPDSFDLDPASPQDRPWPTARTHFTVDDNGLILPWEGRIWLNPPYSVKLLTRFMGRMAAHDRGTALTFARTETDAFRRFVWGAASGILFLHGRLNFHYPDGRRARKNGGAPSVLIAYGHEDLEILSAAPIEGHFIPLRFRHAHLVKVVTGTWAEAVEMLFPQGSEAVPLAEIYRAFADHPKSQANQNWRAKLRQVLQRGAFERVDRGVWRRCEA